MATLHAPQTLPHDVDALVIVDAQVGFINEYTQHVASTIVDLTRQAEDRTLPVIATQFINARGSLYRSRLGWDRCGPDTGGTDLIPGLDHLADRAVVKYGYGARGALADRCGELAVTAPLLVGIDTDSCVLACAVELFDRGIWPRAAAYACASTGGPDAHSAGLMLLARMLGDTAVVL